MFHLLREPWNPWMTISIILHDFEWKTSKLLRDFMWNCKNYGHRMWSAFHNLELMWNMIPWNAKNCFRAWIFCGCEFTDPLLIWMQLLLVMTNDLIRKLSKMFFSSILVDAKKFFCTQLIFIHNTYLTSNILKWAMHLQFWSQGVSFLITIAFYSHGFLWNTR